MQRELELTARGAKSLAVQTYLYQFIPDNELTEEMLVKKLLANLFLFS